MDEDEQRWASLLMESVEQMRQRLQFATEDEVEVQVKENALLRLINRAETLVDLLRRREPREPDGSDPNDIWQDVYSKPQE